MRAPTPNTFTRGTRARSAARSRQRIMACLKAASAPPCTGSELATMLEIPVRTVRRHIDGLMRDGIVARSFARAATGNEVHYRAVLR